MIRITFAAALLAATGAHAHVTLDEPEVQAGAATKITFNITHGCGGSPTQAVAVFLPPGALLLAKAQAKPGWRVSYQRVTLPAPIELHGRAVTETVSVIRWEGGPLPNDQFDAFTFSARVADNARGALPIRVLQTCEKGEADWKGPPGDKEPAPRLQVSAPASADPHAGHKHH